MFRITIILLLFLVVGNTCLPIRVLRQATTPEPEEETIEEDEQISERARQAAELFPETISKVRATRALRRALEMLEKPRQPAPSKRMRTCKNQNVEQDAANILKFVVGEGPYFSSSDDSQSQLSSQSTGFCAEEDIIHVEGTTRQVSASTMQNILRLHDAGQSERSIQGKYPWFERRYINRFREYLESGGTVGSKQTTIDAEVWQRVQAALNARRPIHDYLIQQWARDTADRINATRFAASDSWLLNFKRRHNIVSRKVTTFGSRAETAQQDSIEESRRDFRDEYLAVGQLFPPNLIWNVDQSNFNYEISNERTLALRGDRDVTLELDSKNKNTHSYTVQPLISRDGRIIGKLLLCMQEAGDSFGPRVEQQVRDLEHQLGNVYVVASRSGKMSSRLMEEWADNVLVPARRAHKRACNESTDANSSLDSQATELVSSQSSQATEICAGPSWASEPTSSLTDEQQGILAIRNASASYVARPDLLLLMDLWGGHSGSRFESHLGDRGVMSLKIPKHTTGDIQPLDVNFFRQYKKFVKRVTEEAIYQGMIGNVTSRLGIINMHGVIWDQFASPAYRDMITYAWRNTDPEFSSDELVNGVPPAMVNDIQFETSRSTCEVHGCDHRAFIKCSHCEKNLCLQHFLERKCFHCNDTEQGPSTTTPRPTTERNVGMDVMLMNPYILSKVDGGDPNIQL